MRELGRVIAQIPARAGSKRVPAKNLRLLDGRPLLAYAIECARDSGVFDEVFVNSDSPQMLELGRSMGVSAYERPAELASDTATGDEFTIDFIRAMRPDTLAMISPVCPLVTASDVSGALDAFRESDCDTLITCERTQMQTFCEGLPVNIELDGQLAPTQQNPPVEILNWAVTVWDAAAFERHFEETGSAYIGRRRLLQPIDPLHGLKISQEADFRMAELLLHSLRSNAQNADPVYWSGEAT